MLGLAIALAFGTIIEIGGVTGGEPWQRLPLARGRAPARGCLRSARSGALLGALARDARTASLVALLVVMPIVFLGLVPAEIVAAGRLGERRASVHPRGAASSAPRSTTCSPWASVAREGLWLLALGRGLRRARPSGSA